MTAKIHLGEIWRPVVGYESWYEVSNTGKIRSLSRSYLNSVGVSHKMEGRVRSLMVNPGGYHVITAGKKGSTTTLFVHVAIAKAFIPNPENKPQVNHINGVKTDNRIGNLEWVTRSENMLHAFKTGLLKPTVGVDQSSSVLTEDQVIEIFNNKHIGAREYGRRLNVAYSTICAIRLGKTWNHITKLPKFTPIRFR